MYFPQCLFTLTDVGQDLFSLKKVKRINYFVYITYKN